MSAPQREALARRRAALSPSGQAALAQRLRGLGDTAPDESIPLHGNGSSDAPLSFTQEQFWLRQQAFPDDAATNVFVSVRLLGHLDTVALQRGCTELVGRHEVLRSRFFEVGGQPRQRAAGQDELAIRHTDLGSSGAPLRTLEQLARAEAGRPFDLAADPPLRALLVRLADDDHALLLTIHHIATDAWSNAVLLEELGTIYHATVGGDRPRLASPALQFADFARWQREQLGANARDRISDYWRSTLASAPRGLELPADRPRSAGEGWGWASAPAARRADGAGTARRSARLVTSVPAAHLSALARFCQSIRVPTFAGLMAVLQTLLHRYSRATDFLVGVPFSGRQRPDLMRVVGPLFTTVPLRADLSGSPSFVELATRVRATAAEAFNHSGMPPDRFLTETRGSTPYDVLFALQDAPRPAVDLAGLTIDHLELGEGTAQCPLTFSAVPEAGGLRIVTDYDRELFDKETIERLTGHYGRLAESLVAAPNAPVGAVPMLTARERTTALVDWNATAAPRPPGPVLPELFRRQVRRTPDAPALRCGADQLSYVELERRADRCAERLAALGVGRGDVVGVCLDRSTDLVATLLAVLITGAAYLPLDPAHPAERRERALRQAGARVVLTDNAELDAVDPPPAWRPPAVDPRDVAYVIYTSGSTGAPKGVVVAHDGVCNNAAWRREITGLGPGDRLLHTVSFAFDPSVWQLFGPLLAGAEVIMAEQRDAADPKRFVELVRRHRVTVADFVPSVLTRVLDVAQPGELDSLAHVFCGGERLPRDLADRCHRQLRAVLHNQYGPTEATIDTTSHLVGRDEAHHEVSIGRPIANKRVYVLDRYLEPVPPGVAGELWIGGTGLAYGYLNAAAETAARFRPDPFGPPGARMYRSGDLARHRRDGTLEFLGRTDDQVKVNGVRIEPAEISDVLRRHPDVTDAVAVLRDVAGRASLVAYVVSAEESTIDGSALRAHVAEKLPPAFVPAHVVAVREIPLGVTGKVASDRLPEVHVTRDSRPSRTVQPGSAEDLLIGLWREVLGRDDITVDDDFFSLGGDSLLAVRLVAAVRDAFAVELTLPEFFEASTAARLAARVAAVRTATDARPQPALVRHSTNHAPLSFAQERVYRRALAGAGPDELELSMVAHLHGDLDVDVLDTALTMVVARHEALRVAIEDARQIVREPYAIDLDPAAGLSLETGRLLNAGLERLGPDEHRLSLNLHRMAADGVSSHILARDLALTYAALRAGRRPELPALTVQHPDYARWERTTLMQDTVDSAVRAWLRAAGDISWLTTAPRSRTTRRVQRTVLLDAARVPELSTVARRYRCSVRTLLLTVWATACADRLGADNLVACVPVSGRDDPALQQVIGRFVNLAVLSLRLDPMSDLAERVDLVRAGANEAYERQRTLPFQALEHAIDQLVPAPSALRAAGAEAHPQPQNAAAPVFPVLFDVADPPSELPAIAGLDIEVRPPRERWTDFGLALQAHHRPDGVELAVLHDPEIYPDDLIAGLFDDIQGVHR